MTETETNIPIAAEVNEPQVSSNNAPAAADQPKRGRLSLRRFFWLLLLIILVIIIAAGYYLNRIRLQLQQQYTQQQRELTNLQQQWRNITNHPDWQQLLQQQQLQLQAIRQRLESQDQRYTQLAQSLADIKTIMQRDQKAWVLAEAEYLLRLGLMRLKLMRDIPGAIAALTGADQRLAELNDTSLLTVRQSLAADITALKAMPVIDTHGAALQLTSMVGRLALLPQTKSQKFAATTAPAKSAAPSNPDSWWQGFWLSFKRAIGWHTGETVQAEEEIGAGNMLTEQLRVELLLARQALIQDNAEVFYQRLDAAFVLLTEHYEREDAQLLQLLTDLQALQQAELFPDFPEIDRSLKALIKYQQQYQPLNNQDTDS